MNEISKERVISCTALQSSYTRVANEIMKTYNEVFGKGYTPEEITQFIQAVKDGKEFELLTNDSDEKYRPCCTDLYSEQRNIEEYHISAYFEQNEYGDEQYAIRWYFFRNIIYYKKMYVSGKWHELHNTDLQKLRQDTYRLKGQYRYFCAHRPPSQGCIPDGWVTFATYPSRSSAHIGEVTYNEKPDEHDLYISGLIYDKEWEAERAFILSTDFCE